MKIARVKLSGFKSFVDPVELRVMNGLTGVVGPNGCGKSNLLEAIRWAMGEGSPKSLRGSGMEDVIFAGTATRPQRQFAEVSILAERDDDEVEVTRRIERGAGSAYRINGRDARARDAQLLFADAATGAHSPALVSQGKIGAIIAAKPAERRAMLEEAAGISGLHVRRREAEIRLKATETNLARVAEVVAEMEARANVLRRQARSAERYRKLSDAIKLAEGKLIYARWRDAAAAADVARAEATLAEDRVVAAAEAQRVAAALTRDATDKLSALRAEAQGARDAAADARHALASAEGELRAVETRIANIAAERDRLSADRDREGELATDAGEALARLADEVASLATRIAAADGERADRAAAVAVSEVTAREAELALAQATAEAAERGAERRVAEAAVAAARAQLDRAERDHVRALGERDALTPLATVEAAHSEAVAIRATAEDGLNASIAALEAAEAARESAAGALAATQIAKSESAAALAALESEARALAPAREAKGTLGLVSAARGYEAALAAALADDLAADVGSSSTAPRRWAGADITEGDPALTAGPPLSDYVKSPPELARRLSQIAVVDMDEDSQLAVGQRLVTRDGKLRRWDGFVSEGTGAAEAERLVRRNRLTEIEAELPAARDAAGQAALDVEAARSGIDAATRAMSEARQGRDAADAALRTALRGIDTAAAAVERARAAHAQLAERLTVIAAEQSNARADLDAAEAHRAALPADDQGAQLSALDAAARTARDAVVAARAQLAALDSAVDADRARQAAATAEAESWKARSGKAAKRIEDMARRAAALDAEAEALESAPDAAARAVRRATGAAEDASAAADATLRAEREAEAILRDREAEAARVGEALAAAREDRAGAAARAENQELRRVEMGRVSGERFECPPPVLPEKLGFEVDSVGEASVESKGLENLTMERERLGPVNLVAEQELAELDASRENNAAEMAELTEATHRLRGSIGSLNREGRLKLRAAFEAVDGHFRELFRTLFNGGEAHLEMIDSDDPLDAGLEIMAQPPGKKLTSLTLLSGGEQALTAVALIFALFLTNPAPLCVLDEVDAPLDDANVERFCDLLDRMTRTTDTRYLIVTHNAVTMARMHRLYGVTMVEQGISRLVSVDLGGAVDLLAAE
ncbi:chromosome segregation protein SMC [Sphingomonas sp. SUN039]|uniref:chromosome segregation protein SMC n=1 Tax=Sphingomonas sp. SUN039 TaxID=2937787 RepID=UPI00216408A9|nr:chromosome segregation protein SMC [Sphingomonas sp. SUN039]UVO52781.1 chromosome segregation protein SMC [Sphingomonas sp. SUN039]